MSPLVHQSHSAALHGEGAAAVETAIERSVSGLASRTLCSLDGRSGLCINMSEQRGQ